VFWLGVQPIAIALSPAWGLVLPHAHITRGALSERGWQEHLLAHQFGSGIRIEWSCIAPHGTDENRVVASIPVLASALSFLSADLQDARPVIRAFSSPQVRLNHTQFCVLDIFYTPPEPPPNL
jgi:hypothetical protein